MHYFGCLLRILDSGDVPNMRERRPRDQVPRFLVADAVWLLEVRSGSDLHILQLRHRQSRGERGVVTWISVAEDQSISLNGALRRDILEYYLFREGV